MSLCVSLLCVAASAMAVEPDTAQGSDIQITIDGLKGVLQGHYVYVSVRLKSLSEPLDSLRLCIAYSSHALILMEVGKGELVSQRNWTDFNYDVETDIQVDQLEPISLLRVVAGSGIADSSGIEPTPIDGPGELVVMKFHVSNAVTFADMIVPLRFVWETCDDNVLHVTGKPVMMSASDVFETGHRFATLRTLHDLSVLDDYEPGNLGLGGPDPACQLRSYVDDNNELTLFNGYLALDAQEGWIEAGGDVSLNGIGYERDDLNLLTDYLLQGVKVFDISREGQILATDANRDSVNGTVADLVTMTRIVNGAQYLLPEIKDRAAIWSDSSGPWRKWWYPGEPLLTKSRVISDTVTLGFKDDGFHSQTNVPLGGIYAIFSMVDSSELFQVKHISGLKMQYGRLGDEVRVLLFPGVDSLTGPLPVGQNDLFSISGDLELKEMQASDYDGNMLYVIVDWKGKRMEFPQKQEE